MSSGASVRKAVTNQASSDAIQKVLTTKVAERNSIHGAAIYDKNGNPAIFDQHKRFVDADPDIQKKYYRQFGASLRNVFQQFKGLMPGNTGMTSTEAKNLGEPFYLRVCYSSQRYLTIMQLDDDFEYFLVGITWDLSEYNDLIFNESLSELREKVRSYIASD